MAPRGLTKGKIVTEAVQMIEETGNSTVSLHQLAQRLGIKTPSLCSHIENTVALQHAIFQYAIEKFVTDLNAATAGKEKDEAVMAFARAYHSFAMENRGLYRLIMSMPRNNDETEKELAMPLLKTATRLLAPYGLPEEALAHWQRVFRAILHGFVSQEDLGYFYYYQNADLEESRDIAIGCFLTGLHAQLNQAESSEE